MAEQMHSSAMPNEPVQVSPYHSADFRLAGLLLHGRWPNNMREWAQLLVLGVRIAAVPGVVPVAEVFRAREDIDLQAAGEPVGAVVCEGPAIGEGALSVGAFAQSLPPALMVLHPPEETTPDFDEDADAASGVLLLPGIPEIGLGHRAAWVQAAADGTVSRLESRADIDPMTDPDLAVLATLLAA